MALSTGQQNTVNIIATALADAEAFVSGQPVTFTIPAESTPPESIQIAGVNVSLGAIEIGAITVTITK
jgi:hypothetical protein